MAKKKRLSLESLLIGWGGRIRTSGMAGPKPAALPLGDAPSRQHLYIIKHITACQEKFVKIIII